MTLRLVGDEDRGPARPRSRPKGVILGPDPMYGSLTYDPVGEGSIPGWWRIQAAPHVAMRLKRVFTRINQRRTGELVLADTPEVAFELGWVMQRWPLEVDPVAQAHLEAREQIYVENRDAMTAILAGYRPPDDWVEPEVPFRDYQLQAASIVHTLGRLLLADMLGVGKTGSAVAVFRNPDCLPAIYVTMAQLPLQLQAVEAIKMFLPDLLVHRVLLGTAYDPVEGPPGKSRKHATPRDPDVLVIPYSKLAGWADHVAARCRTAIYDEVQELRHEDTDKYRAATLISHRMAYVMGMSATPIYNYGGETHTVMEIVAPGALGTRQEFATAWTGGSVDKKARVSDPEALGMYLREEGLMLRRSRADVGREIPDLTSIEHIVDTGTTVTKALGGMEQAVEFAKLLASGKGSWRQRGEAAQQLDAFMRLATGVAKADYVAQFVDILLQAEEPVLLFGWHHQVYDRWAELLADHKPAFYHGRVTGPQKTLSLARFKAGPGQWLEGGHEGTNLMIMSLRAAAGIDGLQNRCSTAVIGELDWSPGWHDQGIGRLHRDGQPSPVVAYYMVANDGSDPIVADVLDIKRGQAEPMVDPDKPVLETTVPEDKARRLAVALLEKMEQLR